MLIMIDGIDGSGKGAIVEAWKKYLTDEGNAVFDLKKYWEKTGEHPPYAELKSYDFIFGHEPTGAGVGKTVRNELVKKENHYSPRDIADGFSEDRLVFYTQVVIPALKDEKCVILDRGVSSSIAYQSNQEGLNREIVAGLPGNVLALKHRPDHLVIADAPPEICLKRLADRAEKIDGAIFEKLDFMKKLSAEYHSDGFQNFFQKLGTQVHYLSTNEKIDIMKERAISLLKQLI